MLVNRHPAGNLVALVERIQPTLGELESAQGHLTTVRRRLSTSFDVSRIVRIGSHARATAVTSFSDLDLLVVLRRNEAKWGGRLVNSPSFVQKVRDDLQDRFVRTAVRRDAQAVVLGFAGGQRPLDIVPAVFLRFEHMRPVYQIPDGLGDWSVTSPERHDLYIADRNVRSGGKLKRVSQLLKWWRFSRLQPIQLQSFHTDLLLAQSGVCAGVKSYSRCLYDAFALLAARECRGLQDPLGISGVVYAVRTDAQWEELNTAVANAVDRASRAIAYEERRDWPEANRLWNLLFNGSY